MRPELRRGLPLDSSFSHLIEPAKAIREGGRWAAVNERLIALAGNPGADNAWWVQSVAAICEHTFSGYLALCAAYEHSRDDAPLLAWRARNLLELSVWAVYCSKSRENARVLYEDAGQDLINLINAFQDWGTAHKQGDEWAQQFADAEKVLSEKAAAEGITGLDGSFKAVSNAAKESGFGKHFTVSMKMLSKYAHPTAMLMLSPPRSATPMHAEMFFGLGSLYFTGAFTALEKLLLPAPDLGEPA